MFRLDTRISSVKVQQRPNAQGKSFSVSHGVAVEQAACFGWTLEFRVYPGRVSSGFSDFQSPLDQRENALRRGPLRFPQNGKQGPQLFRGTLEFRVYPGRARECAGPLQFLWGSLRVRKQWRFHSLRAFGGHTRILSVLGGHGVGRVTWKVAPDRIFAIQPG